MSSKITFQCIAFTAFALPQDLRANSKLKLLILVDRIIIMYHTRLNITATLSALLSTIKDVTRNLGGFSLPAIYLLSRDKVGA